MRCAALLVCVALCVILTTSKPTKKKHKPLSSRNHDDREDFDYDQDAFLGQEEAESFHQLTAEQSKERLRVLVGRMDVDDSGWVSLEELQVWIRTAQLRWLETDTQRQQHARDRDADGYVTWEEYRNTTYGSLLDEAGPQDGFDYRQMMSRDERRFLVADRDGDLRANQEEFSAFLHPEEYDYMKDIIVLETMEDLDRNRDGFIDLEEYIGDMYSREGDGVEPEWVRTERVQFTGGWDLDGNGRLDAAETKRWILPAEHTHSHAEAEAKHLLQQTDADRDGRLTEPEILQRFELFAGSQATDFGEALARHDEF